MSIRSGATVGARGPVPTLRGWGVSAAAALALVFAVLLRRQDLLIIGIFLAILVLAALITVALVRPTVTVNRSLSPDTIAAGDSAQAILTVQHAAPGVVGLRRWRDRVAAGLTVVQQPGTDPVRSTIRAQHRGRYAVGPVLLEFADPFGIASREYPAGSARLLTVTPPVAEIAAVGGGLFGDDGSEQILQRPASPSADELIAREYRAGDPLRRVHWRATARHGELMVRQEEQRSNPEAWLVIDTRAAAGSNRADSPDPDFELVVEVSAALGAYLIRGGFALTVTETARAGDSVFERGRGENSFLGSLAVIQPREPTPDQPARELSDAVPSRGATLPLVAVLRATGPAASRTMASLLPYGEPGIVFLVGSPQDQSAVYPGWSCFPIANRSDIAQTCRRAFGAADRVNHG